VVSDDGVTPEHWATLPDPEEVGAEDSPFVALPDYDLGKNGGYKVTDRPYLSVVATFAAENPGLIEKLLQVEAHLERHGGVAHRNRVPSWLKWVKILTHDLRQWGWLNERKVEIAKDIIEQVTESYNEYLGSKIESDFDRSRTGGSNRHRSYAVACPRCGKHISARDFYEQDPELGFRMDAPLKTRIFRHKRPTGTWCFSEGNLVFDPIDLEKVS
jgi:hypothetical protein